MSSTVVHAQLVQFKRYIQIMQQFGFGWGPAAYFVVGDARKSSFTAQFCRENNYAHLTNPSLEEVRQAGKNGIIEGSLDQFQSFEKNLPELSLIYLGADYSIAKERELRSEYLKIGKCLDVPKVEYDEFRKALYPNLVFVFGAVEQQCYLASSTLASTIGYSYSFLPAQANEIVSSFDKTKNYVINGFFSRPSDIQILENYFNFRVIHFGFEAENLPKHQAYFDFEYDLLPLVKGKPYFMSTDGGADPVQIMDEVTKFLCPELLFANFLTPEAEQYINQYLSETGGLKLSILEIQHLRKRKNLPLATNSSSKLKILTQILYADLNRKEVVLTDFPFQTADIVELQNINRKISFFIDLCDPRAHRYTKEYSGAIYFLENQKRISPSMDQPLSVQINTQQPYWIVTGPGSCGKTVVAKFIASQFGYQYIDYEAECGALKEKLASPQDGEEVPAKKFIHYFGDLIKSNSENVYVFDGVSYEGNDIQEWVRVLGSPHVVNLKVEPDEQIKRARKKAEGDIAAEVTEEQTAKATEQAQKNVNWIDNLCEICPSSKVYQVDYKMPQLLAQSLITSILKPRVYLVQANNNLTYQNIALQHNLGFINLNKHSIKECPALIKASGKRDVILCCYQTEEDNLVSQELYWIEKNIGNIRYLGIWQPQTKEIKEELLKLERPPVQEKPKKPEGEEEEEKQDEPEEGQDGPPKKKFDIYEHEWTHPKCHKNLSQWYFKLKKNIKERTAETPRECFDNFTEVLDLLNSDKEVCVYETVK